MALLSTQLHVDVRIAASVGGKQRLDLSEILFAILGVALFVSLIVRRQYRRLDRQSQYLLKAYAVLCIVWLGIVIGRRFLTLQWVISITLVEYLGFALAWYLVFRLGWLSKRSMMLGALALVTVINAWGIALVIIERSRVRASGLLSNINVYVGMALLLTPLLLHWASRNPSAWLRRLAYANVVVCSALVLTSGSRFALLVYPILLVVSAILIWRIDGARRLRELTRVAALSVAAIVVLVVLNPSLLNDLTRATTMEETTRPKATSSKQSSMVTASPTGTPRSPSATGAPLSPSPTGTPQPPRQTGTPSGSAQPRTPATPSSGSPTASPSSGASTPSSPPGPRRSRAAKPSSSIRPADTGDPNYEAPYRRPLELTHGRILARSLAVLEKHWVWGTGRPVIFFDGWGYHPPHNLFLEVLTFIGIVGAVPYFAVALFIPIVALIRLRLRAFRSAYLIGLAALLGYSLLQPLITDQLVLLMLTWGLFGAMMGPDEADWKGLTKP